ncbi:MAG: type IIL restriction-modification enzyme MmeI [Paracoccaceae bacterium]
MADKVTREAAGRLAALGRSFEGQGHSPETVANFLMRCLFTMFAEDVELTPRNRFKDLLEKLRAGERIKGRDREISDQGLIGILRDIHHRTDAVREALSDLGEATPEQVARQVRRASPPTAASPPDPPAQPHDAMAPCARGSFYRYYRGIMVPRRGLEPPRPYGH